MNKSSKGDIFLASTVNKSIKSKASRIDRVQSLFLLPSSPMHYPVSHLNIAYVLAVTTHESITRTANYGIHHLFAWSTFHEFQQYMDLYGSTIGIFLTPSP
ncbi:hypothetical protein Y032_0244g3525 [Ancylostoma ceylanicum]|uniref:Uncharacterized protein n=1 Tax=Ancylostoma ceylanicum TaxID=53326 RepID=A0A016SE03_9BILA|nr:hypothetical protein Y032_0244g3525 [Ancylostoma ceylanicum]